MANGVEKARIPLELAKRFGRVGGLNIEEIQWELQRLTGKRNVSKRTAERWRDDLASVFPNDMEWEWREFADGKKEKNESIGVW